ncbi:hypothetical protein [Sulfurimonas sp.]|uniref:hypothetical protein n=1 Tax=Sulfurimonas sp. TaxID=2022749 RepID=UPI002AB0A670|nr:hypothetical protein [Sulfurimonas sp.]
MKKILSITLISALTLLFSVGCGGTLDVKKYDSKKIEHAIIKAGEKTGWRMTEFKNNEILAEKTEDEKTVSTSIKYSRGEIAFDENVNTSDLQDAIAEELNKTSH